MSDAVVFGGMLIDSSALLGINIYSLITLSDLECDYLNAPTACSKLNSVILPEIISHLIGVFILFVTGHWILFALNVPVILILIHRFNSVQAGSIGLYDPAEIHNQRRLKKFMHENLVKVAFHVVFFFIYLYSLIFTLLSQ